MTRHQRKRSTQALLSVQEIRAIRAVLNTPFERALFEWLYTNGARALARLSDIDLRQNRVRLIHLKHGTAAPGVPLAPQCRAALEAWFKVRPGYDDARRRPRNPKNNKGEDNDGQESGGDFFTETRA